MVRGLEQIRKLRAAQKQLLNDLNGPFVPQIKPQIENNELDREHAPHD